MKYSIIILITQLLLWGCCRSERSILESFYKALDGDKWEHKENWLSDKPLNEWYGITTDEKGKVVKIQLSDTMTGKVPANLKHLKKLQSLHLDCMAGGIRLEVNNYPSLKELGLHGYINQLTVENCSELEKLSATLRYFDAFHVDSCPKLSSLELIGHNISDTTKRELDLSPFPKLSELKIYHLALDQLHINNCFNLKKIEVDSCQLQELNLSSCANLEYLKVSGNDSLHALDLSCCMKLDTLNVNRNSITQLDVSNCNRLRYLNCLFNKLPKLNVSKCGELEVLAVENNNLSVLDISKCRKLEKLGCYENNLTELDLSQNTELYIINCFDNNLSKLDVSRCGELRALDCGGNLKELDLSKCPNIEYLNLYGTQLTSIDISNHYELCYFNIDCTPITTIWVWDGFDPSTFDEWRVPEGVECKIKQ